ncbi:cysteine-rich receptor-like protein kinase 8 [Tanacetum coccineum]
MPSSQQQPPPLTREPPEDTSSPNHPLFLHQNDHPGLILISKKLLVSDNYSSWRRSMTIALNAKNKLKIITKEYPEPNSNSSLRALWERNKDMIISWILNTVLEQINESFANLRGQILLMQPLPTTTKAYGMLRQEEKQRESLTPKHIAPTVMSTFSNNNYSSQSQYRQNRSSSDSGNHRNEPNTRRSTFKQGMICGKCQKEGHYKSECYQLVGYPVGHPLYGKVRPVNNNRPPNSRPRTVNLTIGSDVASTSTMDSQRDTQDDVAVFAKMDNL